MEIEEIEKRIEEIEESRFDDEVAHAMEDDLRADFIDYIAEGGDEELQEKARLISCTSAISFCRWCA